MESSLSPIGSHHDEEWFAAFGPDEPEVMGKFIAADNKIAAYQRFFQYYRDHFHEISLYPGMREILEKLYKDKVKLALFTGAGKRRRDIA